MVDTSHVSIRPVGVCLLVTIKCEKVSEPEVHVLSREIAQAAEAFKWRVAINLREVRLLSSMGLGMLVTFAKNAKSAGSKSAIYGLDDNLKNLFKITKLDKGLNVVADEAGALRALA